MTVTLEPRPVPDAPAQPPARSQPGTDGVGTARSLLRAVRPHQWAKNALVVLAPALAGAIGSGPILLRAGVMAGAWSLVASAAYLLNDVRDFDSDRVHPTKRRRPIASGELARRTALAAAAGLGAAGLVLAASIGLAPLLLLLAYVLLTAAYSLRLKRLPYVELVVVAAGFVLRAATGATATGVAISPALLGAVAAVAVLATAGKRLGELQDLGVGAVRHRAVLGRYRAKTLGRVANAAALAAPAAYAWWVLSAAGGMLSFGWVASSATFTFLIDRYANRALRGEAGDPFDAIRHDRGLALLAVGWLMATALALCVG